MLERGVILSFDSTNSCPSAQGVYSNGTTLQSGPNTLEGLDNSQMICFEAVLDFVDGMSNRLTNQKSQRWPEVRPN